MSIEEVIKAYDGYNRGECPHEPIIDKPCFMYDSRGCYICGQPLGLV